MGKVFTKTLFQQNMDETSISHQEDRTYTCRFECLFKGLKFHDYGSCDKLRMHYKTEQHQRMETLMKELGLFEIVDLDPCVLI